MEKVGKEDIWPVVDALVRKYRKTIPDDLLEEYKSLIVKAVHELFNTVYEFYEDDDIMFESVKEFVEAKFRGNNDVTDGYMLLEIPVVLPVELAAMMLASNKATVVDDVVALREMFGHSTLQPLETAIKAAKLKEFVDELHDKMMTEQAMKATDKKHIH